MTSVSSDSSMSDRSDAEPEEPASADEPPTVTTEETKEIDREKIMGSAHNFATMREIVSSPDAHHSPTHSWETTATCTSHEHVVDHHVTVAPLNDKHSNSVQTTVLKQANSQTTVHIPEAETPDIRPRKMSSVHKVFSPPTVHIHDEHYHHDVIAGHDVRTHRNDPSLIMAPTNNAHDAPAASILIHNNRAMKDPLANHIELTHHHNKKYKSRANHISGGSRAGLQTPQSKQSIVSDEGVENRGRRSSSAVHPNTHFHNTLDAQVKDEEWKKNQEEAIHRFDTHPSADGSALDLPLNLTPDISHNNSKFTESTILQNDDNYRIERGWLEGYVRQDWHTYSVHDGIDELRAGWVELFFDLIFVACIVHISYEGSYSIPDDSYGSYDSGYDNSGYGNSDDYYSYGTTYDYDYDSHRRLAGGEASDSTACYKDGDYDFLMSTFAQFGLLTVFWQEQVMYTTHFVLDKTVDELLRVSYMTCVLAMGIFVSHSYYPTYNVGFFVSYLMVRVVSICMYLRVIRIKRARNHALYHIVFHSAIITALISLLVIRYEGCAMDYFLIYLALFVVEYGSGMLQGTISDVLCHGDDADTRMRKISIPLNVPHISERYGLFVMIILGEALIAVMTQDVGGDLNSCDAGAEDECPWHEMEWVKIAFYLMIFILSYCIGRLYFNCQPSEEAIMEDPDGHALRAGKMEAKLYIHSHHVLFIGLLGYGVGIKIAGKNVIGTKDNSIDVLLPGYSLVLIVICVNVIRYAHPFGKKRKGIWIFRFSIIAVMAVLPMLYDTINQAIIWLALMACTLALVLTDVEGKFQKREEVQHQKSKRTEAKKVVAQRQLARLAMEREMKNRRHTRAKKSMIGFI